MDSTEVVIQVVGLINGGVTGFDGQYVVEFDPSRDGREPLTGQVMMAHLRTTPNLDEATRYTSTEAFELWRSVDPRNPVRPDGRPNRPFTAFSISVSTPENVLPGEVIK
jgi:hypothetical protein